MAARECESAWSAIDPCLSVFIRGSVSLSCMPEHLPARSIDRAALERIIQRAAELQTGDRDIGEHLTQDEVLALGKEVGIPAQYLRQAMLEEQTRTVPAAANGVLDRLAGRASLGAERVVRGDPEQVQGTLLRWMNDNELLTVQREQPGRIRWEPLGGMQAAIRRSTAAFGGGKRPFMLSRVDLVTATITPLEPGYCHVSLEASVRQLRSIRLGGAAALLSTGAASTVVLITLGAWLPVALVPLPLFLGLGYGVARQRSPDERVQLGLECVLDQLERGEIKPSHTPPAGTAGIVGLIAKEVRKALK